MTYYQKVIRLETIRDADPGIKLCIFTRVNVNVRREEVKKYRVPYMKINIQGGVRREKYRRKA